MSKQAIMETLKKALGESLTESAASEISSYLETLVADRANASSLSLQEQLAAAKKEAAAAKQKLSEQAAIFEKEAATFAGELAEAFTKKEKILFEELENYKEQTLKVVEQTSTEYREQVEKMVEEVSNEYRNALETEMVNEASNFRKSQEAALAKDVKAYREGLLEKIDQYLEAEIRNHIPEGIMEAAAKAKAYEGLVEGMVSTFSKNYIKLDSTGYEALKAAKKESESLAEQFNTKVKEAVSLTAQVRDLEKKVKFTALTEGMTQAQKSRAAKLLESASAVDIERKFDTVKDYIINESVKQTTVQQHVATSRPQVPVKSTITESAKKQLEKIEEEVSSPTQTSGNVQMESWKKSLDRMNRRV
jgi:hypothetical protein